MVDKKIQSKFKIIGYTLLILTTLFAFLTVTWIMSYIIEMPISWLFYITTVDAFLIMILLFPFLKYHDILLDMHFKEIDRLFEKIKEKNKKLLEEIEKEEEGKNEQ
ncbi:MAG: hypothetical protein GWP09_01735 [Nitrospiraceae bacterium]|nr:hypothetical protein [Nitrospiraceae bacterium]